MLSVMTSMSEMVRQVSFNRHFFFFINSAHLYSTDIGIYANALCIDIYSFDVIMNHST